VLPTTKSTLLANEFVVSVPGALRFRSTETVFAPALAVTSSG
jgi:hypothetical protein